MNKFSIALAALSLLTFSQAFANFVPGRVDTAVSCTNTLVNGYSVEITNTEGNPADVFKLFRGGVAGYTQIAGPVEVKMTTVNYVTTIVDTATGGEKVKLVIDQNLNKIPSNDQLKFNSRARIVLQQADEQDLALHCGFPAHIM